MGSNDAGNVSITNIAPVAPYYIVMDQIYVLLVDHDPKALFETKEMLELCSYKVTTVDNASSAITILSNENTRFDLVIASAGSPDLQGYKLMQLAVSMSIPFVLLSVDEDAFFTTNVVQDGAYLNIQKPVPIHLLKYLWQLVFREKVQKIVNHMDESFKMEPPVASKCIEWTDELHSKFVDAVLTLGEGRCFPKEIMKLMNVPGLTRMQVASHLQKCRQENQSFLEERIRSGTNSDASLSPPLPIHVRRFGSMPRRSKSLCNRTKHNQTGLVQSVMGGSTKPVNQVVDNNSRNLENYGARTNQYLTNQSDDSVNISDMDCLIKNFPSKPQDPFVGLFDHEPNCLNQDDCSNTENYDQRNEQDILTSEIMAQTQIQVAKGWCGSREV